MITVKVITSQTHWITSINATFPEAKDYFLGNWFNLGTVDDDMQKVIEVRQIG